MNHSSSRDDVPGGPTQGERPPGTTLLGSAIARLLRLTRKELYESLRDRRTILTLMLMPLLLYPLLAIAFQQVVQSRRLDRQQSRFRVAFESDADRKQFLTFLGEGNGAIARRHAAVRWPLIEGAREEPGPEKTPPHHTPPIGLEVSQRNDLEAAVRQGDVDVAVRLMWEETTDPNGRKYPHRMYEIIYSDQSDRGRRCVRYFEALCTECNLSRLQARERGDEVVPVDLRVLAVEPWERGSTSLLAALLPLILVLMTITGAVYPAIDLTAGERERGTLEVLVAAPIPRMSVLFAKYVAVMTVAMLTAIVNLLAMTVTLLSINLWGELFGDQQLTVFLMLQVFGLLVLFAGFFSAVLLTLTSFARSFKEAQAYLIPLMLLALTPGILALLPGMKLEGVLVITPLLNIVLLTRDLFSGQPVLVPMFLVIISTSLYAFAALSLAARIFGTEAVVSNTGFWTDMFRRPADIRDVPTASSALLCLALMFPMYFLLTSNLGQAGLSFTLDQRLTLSALGQVVLFIALPALFMSRGRIRPVSALQLRIPARRSKVRWRWGTPLVAVGLMLAALLVGLTAWPVVSEVAWLLREVGFSTLQQIPRDLLQNAVARLRTVPVVLVWLTQAAVPAVLEELFFRGFLFSAFAQGSRKVEEGSSHLDPSDSNLFPRGAHGGATSGPAPSPPSTARPVTAIISTALLFALFHLLVGGVPLVDRLAPSFLLGLVLGWVCWRTGSVLPGMLLHLAHNSVLILGSYYQPQLESLGLDMPGELDPVPVLWVLLGAGGSALGLLGLWWGTRPGGRGGDHG